MHKTFIGLTCIGLGLLCSCINQKKATLHSKDFFDFKKEIARLNSLRPEITKTIVSGEKMESKKIKPNWEKELELFLVFDLNQPGVAAKFSKEEKLIQGSDNSIVEYKANSDSQPVQLVRYVFKGDKCANIYILKKSKDHLRNSELELFYEPGISYRIHNKTNSQVDLPDLNYMITGIFAEMPFGNWVVNMDLGKDQLPFELQLTNSSAGGFSASFNNADEFIQTDEVQMVGDSIIIGMPYYNSELKFVVSGGSELKGKWFNYHKGEEYQIPVSAKYGSYSRFSTNNLLPPSALEGVWEVMFYEPKDSFPAIGRFKQHGNLLTGTFQTETGDFRYLEGVVDGDSLKLSCFDGSHAFLFVAKENQGVLEGLFYSGNHYVAKWKGRKNPNAELTNPDSITKLAKGYDNVPFELNAKGVLPISLSEDRFNNKVVIIQIMGSWCPNCKDETEFLIEIYNSYHLKDVEIIALAFETGTDNSKIQKNLDRYKNQLGVPYDVYYAGDASKKSASQFFPSLTEITSYPTTLFLDRNKKVRKIHTGFNGKGTGMTYDSFKESTVKFLNELIEEREL